MSWEPAWVPDGRGGFRRNRAASEEGEEVEESGEMKENDSINKKSGEDDDTEEEGEITPFPHSGIAEPPRSSTAGHLDYRSPNYRGRVPNNSRLGPRERPRQRNSFSGNVPSQRMAGNNNNTGPFSREVSFPGGNNNSNPFSSRDGPAPPPPPPPFRGEPPSFRDSFGARDFRNEPSPQTNRDFSDGPPSRDFRGEPPPPPSRDFRGEPSSRDFRGDAPNRDFRNELPARDFRGEPPHGRDFRGPNDPSGRDYRGVPPNRDFRGPGEPPNRDYRVSEGPLGRDFRERIDTLPHPNREFRGGKQPSRDRELPPFGSSGPSSREPAFRDGPSREMPFRDGPRDPPYRDGLAPFRDGTTRDPPFRDVPKRESSFQGSTRERDAFSTRDPPFPNTSRDQNRETRFGDSSVPPAYSAPAATKISLGQGVSNVAPKSRPTDPRRRPSKESGSIVTQGSTGVSASNEIAANNVDKPSSDLRASSGPLTTGSGFADGSAISTAAASTRRMGSYSSLADKATIADKPLSTSDPSIHNLTIPVSSTQVPRPVGGFRSPPARRTSSGLSSRNERGDYYGPTGIQGQARHWSAANDRGRLSISNSTSIPGRLQAQQQQQTQSHSSQQLPLVPPVNSRSLGFRQNDPRFKILENAQSDAVARPDQGKQGKAFPKLAGIRPRPDEGHYGDGHLIEDDRASQQSVPQNAKAYEDIQRDAAIDNESRKMTSYDPFGRTRDWKDRPFGNRTPNATPKSSPVNQKATKVILPSPEKDRLKTSPTAHEQSQPAISRATIDKDVMAGNDVTSTQTSAQGSSAPRSALKRNKSDELPPLRMALLGDKDVIKRAEAAVQHLMELLAGSSVQGVGENQSLLPTKQAIMSAIAEIEKLIKESQKESENLNAQKIKALQDEEDERLCEAKRIQEEEKKKVGEVERLKKEHKQQENDLKASALEEALKERQDALTEARKKMEEELEDQIFQAKDDEKTRCYEDMENQIYQMGENFDKDIATIQLELEKAQSAARKVEVKTASIELEYKTTVEIEESGECDREVSSLNGRISSLNDVMATITADNKRRAAEAQVMSLSMMCDNFEGSTDGDDPKEVLETSTDPKYMKSLEQWSVLANQVTGLDDALYSEPSESPYFQQIEETHALIGPSVKEYIRDKRKRLLDQWTQLAEEYEVRKRLYEKQQKKLSKTASQRGSLSVAGRKSIMGEKESSGDKIGLERGGSILESSVRASNNPYRRARRGNEVRSEYEQEQIIAEIAAKEAMEKRITHGGSKLPRQICRLERDFTASYVNTFTAQKVDDPIGEAESASSINCWSDMEKCIFLDRFLQFPKDFHRIASFLRNKTTKDCVAFYYNSKQMVPYKGALKEHMMRRKRRGDYQIWDASIQAAISVGATVTAGTSEEKPLVFSLPNSDRTYRTRPLHPLRRDVLDCMVINEDVSCFKEDEGRSEDTKLKSKKRGRDPLFCLDKEHTKFLRMATQESMASVSKNKSFLEVNRSVASKPNESDTPVRKAPQKWTLLEKKIFLATLEEHGRNWAMLSKAVGTKSISQIKNFYYDYKKQSGKYRASDKKANKVDSSQKTLMIKELSDVVDGAVNKGDVSSDAPALTLSAIGHELASNSADHAGVRNLQLDGTEPGSLGSLLESDKVGDEAGGKLPSVLPRGEVSDNFTSDSAEHRGNRDLIQQLLSQQIQQQIGQQQQLQLGQKSQSALHQLLSQHHHQREQQQQDEARRLLQHQSHSHQQQVLSNMFPWVTASQLFGLQQAQAAALQQQQQEGAPMSSVSDIVDVANLQRLLRMQQASQNPFGVGQPNLATLSSLLLSSGGLNSSGGAGLPTGLLSQMEILNGPGSSSAPDSAVDNLNALAGAQGLLGFGSNSQISGTGSSLGGGGSAGNSGLPNGALYRAAAGAGTTNIESAGVSDALSLLARAIPKGDGNAHGFSGVSDRKDVGDRFK